MTSLKIPRYFPFFYCVLRRGIGWLYLRDDFVVTPAFDAQYGIFVSPPDGARPHDCKIPKHDISLAITRCHPLIPPQECGRMDWGFVASEDVFGDWGAVVDHDRDLREIPSSLMTEQFVKMIVALLHQM